MRDYELLQDFARRGSQEAFRQVVARHVDAVYAAARRQIRDPQLAEDVTQAVFVVLSRKAAHLDANRPLAGWLMKTTWFACRDVIKAESRRKRHEQKAAAMMPIAADEELSAACQQLSPELDQALMKLGDVDRGAVALRYLEGRSVAEVADALGLSIEAASKRIARALDRMRRWLVHHGIVSSAVPLGTLLEHLPQQAAPSSLAGAAAAAATSVGQASACIAGISKGTLNMMLWSKAKAAAVVLGAMLAAGGAAVGTVSMVLAQHADAPARSAAPALAPPAPVAASGFVGRLDNGVSIELVGLCENPSTGNAWWYPDGTPIPQAPYHSMGGTSQASGGRVAREVAVRIRHSVRDNPDPATVSWNIVGSGGWAGGTAEDAQNRVIPGLIARSFSIPDKAEGTVLRADVASGPWKTIVTADTGGMATARAEGTFLFSSAFEPRRNETRIVLTRTGKVLSEDSRLVAIDLAGKQYPMNSASSISTDTAQSTEYSVRLALSAMKEFQFQTRPYNQWIEIRNIALNLGQQTEVKLATSDDAAAKP